MRDVLLLIVIAAGLVMTVRRPFVGVLLWTWFTCQQPNQEVYGFSHAIPMNLVIAIVTLGSLALSRERKLPRNDGVTVAIFIFLAWITFNGFFAVAPDWSWPLWDRDWRVIVLGILVGILVTSEVRAHALIWVVVISMFYYGVKGGIFTLVTGGHFHVQGPENSGLGDNNVLALALLMSLPMANYLRMRSKHRYVSVGLLIGMALTSISVIGTYSRGAFIAMGVLGLAAFFRSRRKLLYLISTAVVIVPILYFMPQSFHDRIATITTASQDDDFMSRVRSWMVAYDYARDHFPLGAGMSGPELPQVYNHYYPGAITHAAHSIFAEVLGDNGFVGLAIYLTILWLAFAYAARVRAAARGRPELAWASDMALMIQLTLLVFCAGGSALSMAYYDQFFIYFGLLSAMLAIARQSVAQNAGERADRQTAKFSTPPLTAPASPEIAN